jgi:hypothetical protein
MILAPIVVPTEVEGPLVASRLGLLPAWAEQAQSHAAAMFRGVGWVRVTVDCTMVDPGERFDR